MEAARTQRSDQRHITGPRPSAGPARGSWWAAAALFVVLAAFGARYGYHRDELYFIEAGRHPAWGYPDQPPLVPLLAAGWDAVTGGRLWLFRLVPALAAALLVPIAAAVCARFGGGRREQVGAAVLTALCSFVVGTGHLFATSTFTLLLTAWTLLLLLRALDDGDGVRSWLPVGLVAGVSLQVQTLPAIVLACCVIGLLVAGPRQPLRSPGPYLAGLLALLIGAPNLIWQAAHGWPQLTIAADIAAGGSTSSAARWQIVPFQLLIAGPLIAVVLLAGLWQLLRRPALRRYRWVAVAYLVLLVVVTVTGGKPYYASTFFPLLFAAGVPAVLAWIGDSRPRRAAAGVVLVAHAAGTALISLPLAPPGSAAFQIAVAVNPDAAETVGWPQFVDAVSAAALSPSQLRQVFAQYGLDPGIVRQQAGLHLPGGDTVVLAHNYGEAGALDHARFTATGFRVLPRVFSGQNGYGEWGPPPESATSAVVAGDFTQAQVAAWFTRCLGPEPFPGVKGVDNEEQGVPIWFCVRPRQPWAQLWPQIRRLG